MLVGFDNVSLGNYLRILVQSLTFDCLDFAALLVGLPQCRVHL